MFTEEIVNALKSKLPVEAIEVSDCAINASTTWASDKGTIGRVLDLGIVIQNLAVSYSRPDYTRDQKFSEHSSFLIGAVEILRAYGYRVELEKIEKVEGSFYPSYRLYW